MCNFLLSNEWPDKAQVEEATHLMSPTQPAVSLSIVSYTPFAPHVPTSHNVIHSGKKRPDACILTL